MKPNPNTLLAAVSASLLLAANGDVIVPVSWKQSNAYNADRVAAKLSNDAGMDSTKTYLYNQGAPLSPGETTSANGKYWMTTSNGTEATAAAAGKVWIVADLGATYDLTTLKIWNVNWDTNGTTTGGDVSDRGVSQFDVLVRNAVADTADGTVDGTAINTTNPAFDDSINDDAVFNSGTSTPWTEVLANQALAQAANNDTHAATSYNLPTNTTGRFVAIRVDSYYGGAGIGLGKVRIEGTPGTDNVPPTLDLKSPVDDATDAAGNADLVATFSEAIQAGTGNITIRKTSDNSLVEAFDAATSTRLTFGTTTVTINPTANLAAGTGYYVQIDSTAIKDMAGNFFAGLVVPDTTSWSFSIETTAPTLATTTPFDDATDVAGNANLEATFNEPVQAGTGNITIRKTSDNTVVESFNVASSTLLTFANAKVTVNPTANLVAGTGYYVQIDSTAVKDMAGNPYAGIVDPDTTSWSFTVETTAPTLVSTTPLDDATNVPTGSNLVATFSEAVQAGTGTITIKKTSDNSVVESFDVATSTQLAFASMNLTINPTANLAIGIGYYLQIDASAIKDLAGNPYLGIVDPDTTTWSFTTDNTAPMATSLSPATPTKALVGTRLLVQFNEAVQAGTGTLTVHKASDNSLVETIDVTTPGAVAINGKVAAIARAVVLEPDTAYYVNANAGAIQDVSGNPAAAITGNTTWTFTTSPAIPLVVENFNSAVTPLNGTAADIFAAAITTSGGSAAWGAGTGFLENGAVGAASSTQAFLNLGSYINDTKGTPAGRFELTMTLSENDPSWVSLGFSGSTTPSTTGNFTSTSGVATIIYRGQNGAPAAPNINGEIDMFGGFGNANGVDEGAVAYTGFRTLTVALDLTEHNGTSNFGKVTWSDSVLGDLGSHSFTANRNFTSILISQATSAGTINALALYQTGSPTNTYANWIGGFNVGTLTGPGDDFDNDGLDNAVENLFGTSPEVFSPGLTSVSTSSGNLKFRHTLNATPASDLTGSYEWSTDLAAWHASGASAGGTTVTFGAPVVVTPGTPDLIEITATVAGTPASRIFARFKATQN